MEHKQEYFLPSLDRKELERVLAGEDDAALFELLKEPLHEELYRRQDFNFLDELTEGQQLLLSYDYLLNQVGQGGFIQFLVNGYVGLLPEMPAWLEAVGAQDMAQVIDDVIRVYVLNVSLFPKEMSNEQFARLYDELQEFRILDGRFQQLNDPTIKAMMGYARTHLEEFVAL